MTDGSRYLFACESDRWYRFLKTQAVESFVISQVHLVARRCAARFARLELFSRGRLLPCAVLAKVFESPLRDGHFWLNTLQAGAEAAGAEVRSHLSSRWHFKKWPRASSDCDQELWTACKIEAEKELSRPSARYRIKLRSADPIPRVSMLLFPPAPVRHSARVRAPRVSVDPAQWTIAAPMPLLGVATSTHS